MFRYCFISSRALINYISLATARAIQRSKEVVIRKIIGATRKKLIIQFYVESILVVCLAFTLGIGLVYLLQPFFYDLLNLKIDAQFIYHPIILSMYLGLLLISILFSGSLPAFLMAAYQPIKVLRGKLKSGKEGNLLRKGFTVFQFSAALSLMICCVIVYQQIRHFKTNSPDFAKDQILCIPFNKNLGGKFQAYQSDLKNQTGVENLATATNQMFKAGTVGFFATSPFNDKKVLLSHTNVDKAFFDLFQLRWADAPRDMNQIDADYTLIINEKARAEFGEENILGKKISLASDGDGSEVIGVLEDFHYQSLKKPLTPLAISVVNDPNAFSYFDGAFYLKFTSGQDLQKRIQSCKTIHEKYASDEKFRYYFLDDVFDAHYRSETRLGHMLTAFTGFAIIIACLGLFGLITYTTQQRTKEIGIRKVLGASVSSVVKLLSVDFIKLVLIATLIASVVAWYSMSQWLQDFSFRTDIHWWVFALSGLSVLLIALLTISFQTIKVALTNPVKSLKDE
ncbi:MAG: FtsX-like permease family protein [Bacteroidota bacterium]